MASKKSKSKANNRKKSKEVVIGGTADSELPGQPPKQTIIKNTETGEVKKFVEAEPQGQPQAVQSSTFSGIATGTQGAPASWKPSAETSTVYRDYPVGTYIPARPLGGPLVPIYHAELLESKSDYKLGETPSDSLEEDVANIFASSREHGNHEEKLKKRGGGKWSAAGLGQFIDINYGKPTTIKSIEITGQGIAEIHDHDGNPVASLPLNGTQQLFELKKPLKTNKIILVNATEGKLEISDFAARGSASATGGGQGQQKSSSKAKKGQGKGKGKGKSQSRKHGSYLPSNDSALDGGGDTGEYEASDDDDGGSDFEDDSGDFDFEDTYEGDDGGFYSKKTGKRVEKPKGATKQENEGKQGSGVGPQGKAGETVKEPDQ